VILAPGPRGAIIAELIVQRFNRNIPALIGISYMEFTLKSMPSITNYFPFPISKGWQIYIPKTVLDYKDRRILVVDDFCLTGEFFEVLRTFLMDQGFIAGNVKVFCAVITEVTKSANRAPEYYHMVTGDDNFYFPWGKANTG
jgi:hypoxanthine phosphoribosyltransferase